MLEMDYFPIQWFVATVVLTVIILVYYVQTSFSYWTNKKVPHMKPKFPFGNFENLFTSNNSQSYQCKQLYQKFKEQGIKYCGLYSFTVPIFMPIDTSYVRDILVKDFSSFHDRGFYSNEKDQPMSANLFTIDGEKWRLLRSKYSSAFSSGKIKTMFKAMNACAKPMHIAISSHARNKMPINTKDITGRYTIDIIGSCAFGVDCNSFEEDNEFLKQSARCIELSSSNLRNIILNGFPNLAKFLKMGIFPNSGLKYFADLIVNTLAYRENTSIRRQDFLQILKDMKDNNTYDMSVESIQAQSFVFFLAGFETVSSALTFALFELAKNTEIQDKLRLEIQEVLNKYEDLTYDAVNEMKYLQCVIDESLRMYPPLGILNRKCSEDYTIPGTDTILEKGTNIVIPVGALHTDPEYFPNPAVFDPSRFSHENRQNIPPYAYLPFGDGPRNCIGKRFALIEVKVGLINLLTKFKFLLNKSMEGNLDYTAHFVLRPKTQILLDVEEL